MKIYTNGTLQPVHVELHKWVIEKYNDPIQTCNVHISNMLMLKNSIK